MSNSIGKIKSSNNETNLAAKMFFTVFIHHKILCKLELIKTGRIEIHENCLQSPPGMDSHELLTPTHIIVGCNNKHWPHSCLWRPKPLFL